MAAGFKHHCGLWFRWRLAFRSPRHPRKRARRQNAGDETLEIHNPEAILPEDDIRAYLKEAMQHAQDGRRSLPSQATGHTIVVCCIERCIRRRSIIQAAMDALTPGRQREYNEHISSAKRRLQQSRLAKIRPMIFDGKGLNDRYR